MKKLFSLMILAGSLAMSLTVSAEDAVPVTRAIANALHNASIARDRANYAAESEQKDCTEEAQEVVSSISAVQKVKITYESELSRPIIKRLEDRLQELQDAHERILQCIH